MLTILASLIGFLGSIAPEILKFYKDNKDKKHELAIIDRQIEHNQTVKLEMLHEMQMSRQMAEQAALYSTYKSGVSWVDALNGTVRPTLAYFFFIIYAGVKIVQYRMLYIFDLHNLTMIWTPDDQAIFAGIISFYFGQRTFSKVTKMRAAKRK